MTNSGRKHGILTSLAKSPMGKGKNLYKIPIDRLKYEWYNRENQILQLKDRGAAIKSKIGVRRRRAVANLKGIAAEGRVSRTLPGQTEKIRLTVAFAESYVLIVDSLRNLVNRMDIREEYRLFTQPMQRFALAVFYPGIAVSGDKT